MPDFKNRSHQRELIDLPVAKELFFKNLMELDFLNRTFGGHAATLKAIKNLITDKNKTYHIVDLGCGSGDSLMQIAEWAKKNYFKVLLTGIDNNKDAIEFVKQNAVRHPGINVLHMDYRDYMKQTDSIDILHCSLFCHHLTNEEIKDLLIQANRIVKTGLIINDLERCRTAYYGVKMFTRFLKGTSLSKNDGPISVLRGFTVKEFQSLLRSSSRFRCTVYKKWAFRILVIGHASIGN
jgi:ubiquinone/menaquinone biosynthesis C-methylase UbiE